MQRPIGKNKGWFGAVWRCLSQGWDAAVLKWQSSDNWHWEGSWSGLSGVSTSLCVPKYIMGSWNGLGWKGP